MIRVEVDTENPTPAKLLECGRRFRGNRPGCVQIPTATLRIENDVVAHRLALINPCSPLNSAVSERDRSGELKVPAEHVDQRSGNFELQPTLRIDTNSLVTARLSSLSVGGQKHARGVPPIPPLRFVHPCRGQVGAVAPQPVSAYRDRRTALREFFFGGGESLLQDRQSAGLDEPLRRGGISTFSFSSSGVTGVVCDLPRTQGASLLEDIDRGVQIGDVSRQAAQSQLVLVFHRACDRTRPPRRRHRCQRLLTCRSPLLMSVVVYST
jgi:hypothetical protein